MIVWGTKKKDLKTGKITNVACPVCEQNSTMDYTIEMNYFHLYWIPFFPLKKFTTVYCDLCETGFEEKHFTQTIKNKLIRENEIAPARFPVWSYAIPIILGILIPMAILQSNKADTKKNEVLNKPLIGDVYYLSNNSTYTTMKIVGVENDSVHFLLNDTSVTKFTKLFSITNDRYYSNKFKSFSKNELHSMYEKDNIYSIDRKK